MSERNSVTCACGRNLSYREFLNKSCDRCLHREYDSMCPGTPKVSKLEPAPAQGAPNDPVQHPGHYTSHPSGIECIEITRHMGFCLGNVVKYVWRADLKGAATEDLLKAREYLDFEIETRIAKKGTK